MSDDLVALVGMKEFRRMLEVIDRRCTRERQKLIRDAARPALRDPIREDAAKSPGRAGPRLARAVSVRNGKQGGVIVGPRTGKRTSRTGAWFRAIYMIGHAGAYAIPKPAGPSRRRVLYNPAGPFAASAKAGVMHPGIPANPFVRTGTERGQPAFIKALTAALFSTEDK